MSDKKDNLPGRRDQKAVNRPKGEEPQSEAAMREKGKKAPSTSPHGPEVAATDSAVSESHVAATADFSETSKEGRAEFTSGASAENVPSASNDDRKLQLWFRVLAVGLILVALGNAYYTRTLADRAGAARQDLAEELTEQVAARVESQVDSQLEERLAGREESRQEAMTRLANENKQHAEELQEVQEKIATLESTLRILRTETQGSPETEDWDIAEVAYLLRIANERLQLERDVKTSLVALQVADQILRKVADPALTPVRSRLAEEINALKALPTPDISGIALSLSSLIEQVRELELKESMIGETMAAAETTEEEATDQAPEEDTVAAKARRFLSLLWVDLKHLVMVRRRGKGDDGLPILPPEERYFLYRNLELELETARLSLLRQDEEGFRQSLQRAQEWLQTYFQGAEAEVMRETLIELAQTNIRPSLPSISGSLKTLNRVWDRTRSQTTGGN